MYDLIIIGAGPAGLTASLYAGRSRINTLVIEKMVVGGRILMSETIENYPGFPGGSPARLRPVSHGSPQRAHGHLPGQDPRRRRRGTAAARARTR